MATGSFSMSLARHILGIATAMSVLAGAALAEAAGAHPTDLITVSIPSDIRGTNPGVDRDSITDDVLLHVVEGLVAYKEDLTVGPMLAESVTRSDDGLVYTFVLREGVTFQNGAPLTSAEVKWSWDRMMDPATNWLCRGFYDGSQGVALETVEAPDPRTVVFRLKSPSAIFLDQMASFQCLAVIVHPDSLAPDGSWVTPIGTGPYRLAEWKPGNYVLLERHDGYAARAEPMDGLTGGKVAHAKSIKWLVIPDAASAKAALLANQIDLVPGVQPADLPSYEKVPSVVLSRTPSLERAALLIQTADPLLSDVRMRLAIAHAIDFSQLAGVVTRGTGTANASIIPVSSPYYSTAQAEGFGFDIEKARALLQEAGYQGQTIKLVTNTRYRYMNDAAVIMQSMLKKAGINVELEVLDWASVISAYAEGRFQLMSFGFSGRTDPTLAYATIIGKKADIAAMQWDSADAMGLMQQSAVEADPARRGAMFDQLHKMMLAEAPTINLFNSETIGAAQSGLQGYRSWPAAKPRLWGVWK